MDMDDTAGSPILFPEVVDPSISTDMLAERAHETLASRFGDTSADLVMGRVREIFDTSPGPVVIAGADGYGGYSIAIFSGDGVSSIPIPPPPSELSDLDIQECLISAISMASDIFDATVDWKICQILCGFGGGE